MAKKSRKERLYNDAKQLKIDLGDYGDYEASLSDKNYVAQIHGAFKARAGEQFTNKFPDVESFYQFMSSEPVQAPVPTTESVTEKKTATKDGSSEQVIEQVDLSKYIPNIESPVSSTDNLAVNKVPQGKSSVTGGTIKPNIKEVINSSDKEGATKLEKEVNYNISTGKAAPFAGNKEADIKRKKADDLAGVVYESITKDDKIANFFVLPASGLLTQKERGNLTPKLKNIQSVINEYATKYNLDADEKIWLYNGIKNRIETKPAIESAMLNARISTKEMTGIDPIAASFLKNKELVKDTQKIGKAILDSDIKVQEGIALAQDELKTSILNLQSDIEASSKAQIEQIQQQYQNQQITEMFANASLKAIQDNAVQSFEKGQQDLIKGYTSRIKSQIIANKNFVKSEIDKLNSKSASPEIASAMGVFNKQFEEQYAAETSKIANEQLMAYKNKYGALGQIGEGMYSGTGNVIRSLGGYLGSIGQLKAEEVLRVTGDQLMANAKLPAMEMNWNNAADPTFWYNMAGQTIPYMAAVAGTVAATKSLGAGGLVGSALASTMGTAMLESGGVFEDALARGESLSDASSKASVNFNDNMNLIGLNALMLAPFFGKIKGFGATLATEVASEVPEELLQSYYQQKAITPDLTLQEFVASKEGAITAVSAAGLSLGLSGGAHLMESVGSAKKNIQSYMGTRALTKSIQQVGLNNTLASLEINQLAGELSPEDFAKYTKQAKEIAESIGALNDLTDASKYMAIQLDSKIKEMQSKLPRDKESPIYKAKEKQIKVLQSELDKYVLGDEEAMSAYTEGDDAPYPLTEDEVKGIIEDPNNITRIANGTLSINTAGNEKLLKEIDTKISEYQKQAGEILDPLSDMPASMMSTIQRVEEGTPTDPIALEEASNYLYEKYKYLSAMKNSDKRELTMDQIDTYMKNIGSDIELLEKAKYPELSQEEIATKVEENIGEIIPQESDLKPQENDKANIEGKITGGGNVQSNATAEESKVEKPTQEQIVDDLKNKKSVTFTYESLKDVPEELKDKISSYGTINGKEVYRVTLAQSEADYYLANKEQKPTQESNVEEPIVSKKEKTSAVEGKGGAVSKTTGALEGDKLQSAIDKIDAELGTLDKPTNELENYTGPIETYKYNELDKAKKDKFWATSGYKQSFNQKNVSNDLIIGDLSEGSLVQIKDEPNKKYVVASVDNVKKGVSQVIAVNDSGEILRANKEIVSEDEEVDTEEEKPTPTTQEEQVKVEKVEAKPKKYYHAGTLDSEGNIYLTDDKEIAKEYSKISKSPIQEFDINESTIASESEVRKLLNELNIKDKEGNDLEDGLLLHQILDTRFDESISEEDKEKIVENLKDKGYTGIKFIDEDITQKSKAGVDTVFLFDNPLQSNKSKSVSTKSKSEEPIESGDNLSKFKKGDIVSRPTMDDKAYEIVSDKGTIFKLKDVDSGLTSEWNADNNGGFVKKENSINQTAPVQSQETINTEDNGKGNKVEAKGQRRKDVLSTPETKLPVKKGATSSNIKEAEKQLKEEKSILMTNVDELGSNLFEAIKREIPDVLEKRKVTDWESFKKIYSENNGWDVLPDNEILKSVATSDNYSIDTETGKVTMKFPNRDGEFSFDIDTILDVIKALEKYYPTTLPTENKVKPEQKTGAKRSDLYGFAERLVLDNRLDSYIKDAKYNYDQAKESGNKALQEVMKKELETAETVFAWGKDINRNELLRKKYNAQETDRKMGIISENTSKIKAISDYVSEKLSTGIDLLKIVDLSEKYNIPLKEYNKNDYITAVLADDIFNSNLSFDNYLLKEVELPRAKQKEILDSLKTKTGVYNANATKFGSKSYEARRNAEKMYDSYDKKSLLLRSNETDINNFLSKAKNFLDKTIDAIDAEYKRTKGKAFESILGIPVAIYQGALVTLKTTLQLTRSVADAIESAVNYINDKINGAEWDEEGFRSKFTSILEGTTEPSPEPTTPETPPTAPKKKRRGKGMKESGRAKSYRQGRVLQSDAEFNRFIANLRLDYKKKNLQDDFLAPAQALLQKNGFTETGMDKSSAEILSLLTNDPLNNPWAPVAAEILSHEYFRLADEALGEDNKEKFDEYANRAYNLFEASASAYTKSGQFSASAMLGRLLPEHVVIFIGKEFDKFGDTSQGKRLSKRIKEATSRTKEEISAAADEAVRMASNKVVEKITGSTLNTQEKNAKPSVAKKALKERGQELINSGLAKLKKGGYLGSTGLSEDTIEGIAEFIYGHILIGVANVNSIAKKLQQLTNGAIKASDVRNVFETETYTHNGEELPFNQINEQVNPNKVTAQFQKAVTSEKITKKISQNLQERKLELRDIIEENLKAGLPEEIVDYLVKEFNLTPKQAEIVAKDAEKLYRDALEERVNKILAKQLGIKQKASEKTTLAQLNALPLDVKISQIITIDGVEMPIMGNEMLIAKAYSEGSNKALNSQLDKLIETNKKAIAEEQRNKRNHANVIVDQIVAGALNDETLKEAFSEKYGFPVLTPEMIMEVRRLANIAYSMDIDSARALANAKLLEYVHKHVPASAESVLRAMYYTSLLTGISTAFANVRGNASMAFSNALTSYTQDLIDIKNLPAGTDIQTINKSVASSYRNFTQSLDGFLDVMAYGGSENKYYKVDKNTFKDFDQEEMIATKEDFSKEVLSSFSGSVKTLAKLYYTAPVVFQRNLTAMDNAFTSFQRNHLTKRLLRDKYRAQGYKGAELWSKVYADLYGEGEVLVDAQMRAEEAINKLGYTKESRPKLYRRFVADYVQSTLDESIQADAKEFALESTFKGPLRGGAGFMARGFSKLAFGNPTLEAIMFPFVNIGGKIAESFTNFIPGYGLLRGLGYSFTDTLRNSNSAIDDMFEKAGVKKAQRETPELRKRQIIQAALGTLVWATAYALSSMKTKCPGDDKEHPLLEISGGYAGLSYTEKEEVIKNKMPEYSFRFNCSGPIPYKFNPLLAPAFIGLSISQDAERAGKESPEFMQYAMAIPSYILSSLPIKNLKEQLDNLSKYLDDEVKKNGNALAIDVIKYLGGIPANIATPNLYKQVFDYIDPTRYTADNAKEAMFRILNMERIGGNKEAYDWKGETIKFYPGERDFPIQYIFGNYGTDEIAKYIIDNGIRRPRSNKDYVVFDRKRNNVTTPQTYKERYRLDIPTKDIENSTEEFQKKNELRVLTDKEWYDFDKTVRKNVYAILKDGWKDTNISQQNYSTTLDKPFSKMDKYEFQKYLDAFYKMERAQYIAKNFYANVDE